MNYEQHNSNSVIIEFKTQVVHLNYSGTYISFRIGFAGRAFQLSYNYGLW